jgi:hypothetical protein
MAESSESTELIVGAEPWTLAVPPDRVLPLRRAACSPVHANAAQLVRHALDSQFQGDGLRCALTPEDRVTIVIDPRLPNLTEMLVEVLSHVASAGVEFPAMTVLSPPNSPATWIDELPDEFADITAETHDPSKPLAYLATTKAGRRVYLNRSIVEADFNILLTGRRYDPHTGYAGAENALFPALSNEETRAEFAGQFSSRPPSETWEESEAAEIAWLLGTPFLVQVIEDSHDSVREVVAGLLQCSAEALRKQNARWRACIAEEADVVVAALSGSPPGITFLDLARAAANAARAVKKNGRIAILTTAAPELGPGAELLRKLDGPEDAKKLLAKEKPDDWAAAALWVYAAKSASLFLLSGYPDDVAEELFATAIHSQREAQRLIDTGGTVVLIPDAHKACITVEAVE